MWWTRNLIWWFIGFEIVSTTSALSVNKPKLSACASWNSSGITIANSSTGGSNFSNAFIDIHNTLYLVDQSKRNIQILPEKNGLQKRTIGSSLNISVGLFVTNTGDIYLDHGNTSRITKWSANATSGKIIMYINRGCISLFITINDSLYCSINNGHQVVKMSLNNNVSLLTTAAGTGCAGSALNMLDQPFGIYVDAYFYLYVADTGNDRIQLYHPKELIGTTVAGQTGVASFVLNRPTSVILDADSYLFIVDSGNQRIIRSGPNGFQCIIGCSMQSCSQPNRLCDPLTAIFDSYGNIYIMNQNKNGIQKYLLATNSCAETSTSSVQSTIRTTTTTTTHVTSNSAINQTCFPPDITLFPESSDFHRPLQFRRSQDFYITAILKLKCADSLAIKTKWSIFNCTPYCSIQARIDPSINLTFSELYIPARSLIYGLYELKLIVTMIASPNFFTVTSAFVQINPSGITANLVQFGTSLVTSGQQQDLILDPGIYSINPDESTFNASDWTYNYRCRLYNSTNIERWSPIETANNSCFSNRADNLPSWRYNLVNASQSSITILAGALKYDHTYQFVVFMENRRNSTLQATGYVLVKIDDTHPQMVAVACVISTMCSPNIEYQYINPSTQVALFSDCVGKCRSVLNIHWKIYQGFNDSLRNIVEWTRCTQDSHFFGMDTSHFTTLNSLFLENNQIIYWHFEVVYTFSNETSSSALNFIINQPPSNGSCSITPRNGTTSTLFTINCTDWFDDDGIKDYSFYWGTKPSEQIMLAFTILPTLQIQLPAGRDNTSSFNLTVQIRDLLNCVTEYYMEPIVVILDQTAIDALIDILQSPENGSTSNPIIQALASGNQNTVGQVVTLLSQEFNKRNKQNLENAVANGTPATSISVSALDSKVPAEQSPGLINGSISNEYIQKLNNLANIRDYLMKVTTDLGITNIDSIKLQATTLAQLTEATNELTRTTSMLAATKCHQLAVKLKEIAMRISYEDARFASNYIAHCINNVLTAINAPLQQRGVFLHVDSVSDDMDYDTDPGLIELNLKTLADGDDIALETIQKERILYHQKKSANQIAQQATATIALITSILDIHLNIGQQMEMNSPSLLVSLETTTIKSLSKKSIEQVGNASIHLPSNFQSNLTNNASVTLRSAKQPLAPLGASQSQANTNLSTTISLTVLDQYENEIPIHATDEQPIEFFIPRDPNVIVPPMILQNVTSESTEQFFHLNLNQFVMNSNLTVSLHFEIRPLNISMRYLFIYKFDDQPQLNSSGYDIDDWNLFSPPNLTKENIYTYFIDNRRTSGHQSVVFNLRELNSMEMEDFCQRKSINTPPIADEPQNFTSNHELRIYSSGCYYLDKYNNWQSDGLWVGPLTDHYRTQCFSTHLTTFASRFQVLPFSSYKNEISDPLDDEQKLRRNSKQSNQIEKCKQIDQLWNTTSGMQLDPFQSSSYLLQHFD